MAAGCARFCAGRKPDAVATRAASLFGCPPYSRPRPARKHTRTLRQSGSESLPITDLALGQRHQIQPEVRRGVKPCLFPIAYVAVGWRERLRNAPTTASPAFNCYLALLFKPLERSCSGVGNVLICPSIRPLDLPAVGEIGKLTRQVITFLVRQEEAPARPLLVTPLRRSAPYEDHVRPGHFPMQGP